MANSNLTDEIIEQASARVIQARTEIEVRELLYKYNFPERKWPAIIKRWHEIKGKNLDPLIDEIFRKATVGKQ